MLIGVVLISVLCPNLGPLAELAETGNVTGQLRHATLEELVPRVPVVLESIRTPGTRMETTSDEEGAFRFSEVPSGVYDLFPVPPCSISDGATRIENLYVGSGQTTHYNLRVYPIRRPELSRGYFSKEDEGLRLSASLASENFHPGDSIVVSCTLLNIIDQPIDIERPEYPLVQIRYPSGRMVFSLGWEPAAPRPAYQPGANLEAYVQRLPQGESVVYAYDLNAYLGYSNATDWCAHEPLPLGEFGEYSVWCEYMSQEEYGGIPVHEGALRSEPVRFALTPRPPESH
jgi:hypothetical protein